MENKPSSTEWRALYEVAARVKEMAPWTWMSEDMVFGVQSPETEELGFVSVMGMLGEHYAIALYRGPRALYQFWSIGGGGPEDIALNRDRCRERNRRRCIRPTIPIQGVTFPPAR
jgi:hypothetical protein